MKKNPISNFQFPIKSQGFTLMELLVALGVFSIIITVATSIFLGILRDTRFISAQASAIDNTNLAIEQIAREIRTGTGFLNPDSGATNKIEFTNYHGNFTRYSFVESNGKKRIAKCEGAECSGNDNPGSFITSEGINIDGSFNVTDFTGSAQGKTMPRITISAGVEDVRGNHLADLQTTVSPRLLYYK
ncbi:MAG: prepilin-type N-terminal cleavage/methylation domain-containing protein [Candidatus Colwellbacteria bacterium]|nr:prepilin-type N-terminal cleavage/methylation domain-containing protein [Candidatus Colwellbacteria bacterium]